jgi:DNA-binding response OmpR family regulator
MLPKMSGFDICKQLRGTGNATPIIMLTARGQEIDKVVGLKIGADDYVTKPFSFMELMARVEALLRRTTRQLDNATEHEDYSFSDVVISFKKFEVTKAGRPLDISPREFKILKFFIEHRSEVITRDQLLDAVWGYSSFPITRTVDMHIAKLRQKIEDTPHDPRHIITVHRVGYKFIV